MSWRHNCKTSCKHVMRTSWRRLEDVLGRRIANASWRRLQKLLEDIKCYAEDVFKTSWRRLGKQEMFAGLDPESCFIITILTAGCLWTSCCQSVVFMCTQLTNRNINVRTKIEKHKIVVLFASSAFFICFSSNRMKNVTKNCKMVQ